MLLPQHLRGQRREKSRMGDCRTSLHHTCLLHAQPSARPNQLAETRRHTGSRDVGRRAHGEKSRVETCNLISCSFFNPPHPPGPSSPSPSISHFTQQKASLTRRHPPHTLASPWQQGDKAGSPRSERTWSPVGLRLRCYWTFHCTRAHTHAHPPPPPPSPGSDVMNCHPMWLLIISGFGQAIKHDRAGRIEEGADADKEI